MDHTMSFVRPPKVGLTDSDSIFVRFIGNAAAVVVPKEFMSPTLATILDQPTSCSHVLGKFFECYLDEHDEPFILTKLRCSVCGLAMEQDSRDAEGTWRIK
jgi:hypothetical protein